MMGRQVREYHIFSPDLFIMKTASGLFMLLYACVTEGIITFF
jgi:hypothetical protein